MARWIMRAVSCEDGNCPTFRQDADTGDWEIQGHNTDQGDAPAGESRVRIPDSAFRELIAQVQRG